MASILIIDDEIDMCAFMKDVLDDTQHTIHTCISARLALKKLLEQDYDLVITDIVMPNMDGLEFLRILRADYARNTDVPVLAISGGARSIPIASALRAAGIYANNIIEKPFSPPVFKDMVENILTTNVPRRAIWNAKYTA